MARLASLPRRLQPVAPRLHVEGGRDVVRARVAPWRRWYASAEWRELRRRVLERDGYVCRQTGVLLAGAVHAPDSPVVDHIVPHRGDPALFWDVDNLQSVAKAWHDREKQRQERAAW